MIPSAALGHSHGFWGIIAGAALMCALGALDDIRPLHPGAKMLGIVLIACIPAALGVTIDHVTLPLVGAFDLGVWQYPVTVFWIVAIVNIVNFIDGLDGLAAGFCGIASLTFAVLSVSLGRADAAAISAIVAGAAFGFLIYNFNPATIFMGDSGSLMLGYLLAALAIQGVLKTAAAVSLVFPLMVLALPILDTSFVILKRIKHGQPIYQADRWHFHHRFANIGFSQRRTALYLYGWCCILSALALAIRFVPNHRHDWSPVAIGVLVGPGAAGRVHLRVRHLPARDPEGEAPAGDRSAANAGWRGRATKQAGRMSSFSRFFPIYAGLRPSQHAFEVVT